MRSLQVWDYARRSWLEIQARRPRLGIDGRGDLFVHDEPGAIDLAEAGRPSQPEAAFFSADQNTGEPVEAATEGEVAVRCDGEITHIVRKHVLVQRKRVRPPPPFRVETRVLL